MGNRDDFRGMTIVNRCMSLTEALDYEDMLNLSPTSNTPTWVDCETGNRVSIGRTGKL